MTTTEGHDLGERGERATGRFGDKAREAVDSMAARAEQADARLRDAADRAREVKEQAADRAGRGLRRATSYLDNNPLAFAGLAFVAGVLLSTLVRR